MMKKKIHKIGRYGLFVMIMTLLLCFSVIQAQAAQTESEGKTGSIELNLPENTESVQMTLYTVADYKNQSFVFRKEFSDSGIDKIDLNDSQAVIQAAVKLNELVQAQAIQGTEVQADKKGVIRFDKIQEGLFLIAQTKGNEILEVQPLIVPIPFLLENGDLGYDAVLTPKYSYPGGAVIVSKIDDDGNAVGKAQFVLQQKVYLKEGESIPQGVESGTDAQGNYYWKEMKANLVSDDNGQVVVTDIPMGSYRFIEVQAPDGFIMTKEPAYFDITESGQAAQIDGLYQTSSGKVEEVTIVNQQISATINKVDENGNPVAGARLVLKDMDGKAHFEFVTTDKPTVLKQIPVGDYVVSELEAPAGYQIAQDVPLTIKGEDGASYQVTMVDKKETPSSAGLNVIKHLMDDAGNELMTEDGVFYVALFEDEACTSRVSDVRALNYRGQTSSTVSFGNLVPGQTYYVAETDELGNKLESGLVGETLYAPLYSDTCEVTPKQDSSNEFSFDNVFYDLPDGYYYAGHIIITKKVLKGTSEYNTDQTFYAGIFEDPEYTQMYGDVVELPMDGESTVSKDIEISLGEDPSSTMTYYVTETDKDGNPLEDAEDLEFTVSVDNTEVTVNTQEPAEVVITNTFAEDTPTPGITNTPGSSETPDTPNNPDSSSGSPVKTGDTTPIAPFVILIIVAASIIIIAVTVKKNKKQS